jgi:hypothetical protein
MNDWSILRVVAACVQRLAEDRIRAPPDSRVKPNATGDAFLRHFLGPKRRGKHCNATRFWPKATPICGQREKTF